MNWFKSIVSLSALASLIFITALAPIQEEPWQPAQLLSPSDLAAAINGNNKDKPLIICIGPAGLIRGSVEVGPASKKENLEKLRTLLSKQSKDKNIVVYCGCCPFKNCPNIRPAFSLLNSMKFINQKLLDLPHNMKVDWIDHGYPMQDSK